MAKNISVHILGWDKFNGPRKDLLTPTWFRFNHDFFQHPDFYSFTFEERLVWIYILCERSKRTICTFFIINLNHFEKTLQLSSSIFRKTVKKLEQNQIIKIQPYRCRTDAVQDLALTEQNRTNKQTNRTEQNKQTEEKDPEILAAQQRLLKVREQQTQDFYFSDGKLARGKT